MRRVFVDDLRPGMRVGRSIVDAAGRVLLTAGTVLKPRYIQYLRQRGIAAVDILDDLAPDVVPPDVVSPQTRMALTAEIRNLGEDLRQELNRTGARSLRRWADRSLGPLRSAVAAVVDEIVSNPQALLHMQEIRLHDEYTWGHSVDVCILSTLMGTSLGYDVARLRELAMGAVLHDIGKVTIPESILKKPGPLTEEETAEMRQHTVRGFEILRQSEGISLPAAHVAYQHHERWSGGGYPRGLRGEEILEFARVVAVADVYDAMTADRVYRKGYSPERALRNLREVVSDWFEPRMLQALVDNIAVYPVGSLVELNTGEVAVVVSVRKGAAERPRVRIVEDASGRRPERPRELDLERYPGLAIVRSLRDVENQADAGQQASPGGA
ncbi:HD-GYP domain-containing protein [Caldinitratiruptor microaerophilus]|uniref:Phosphodiesterase n=1 Tax=Caldinitratiruptor microaerophilus TaxID=671077 RepID=A0AA35CNM5_9FIRM|nr:HD-GYP domain-containing protein [Caldinitratiruptor microaerophilus]BDG60625.1 phosphodiesterase [Caldinitratiruptor microaerophilus]